MYATYLIPEQNAPGVKAKLDKLARKAGKLGVGAIFYTLAKTFAVPHPHRGMKDWGGVPLTEDSVMMAGPLSVRFG